MRTKKFDFFLKLEIEFDLYFDLYWRAEINIQVGLTYMSTSGMHRRPFEGRHLVYFLKRLSIHTWWVDYHITAMCMNR